MMSNATIFFLKSHANDFPIMHLIFLGGYDYRIHLLSVTKTRIISLQWLSIIIFGPWWLPKIPSTLFLSTQFPRLFILRKVLDNLLIYLSVHKSSYNHPKLLKLDYATHCHSDRFKSKNIFFKTRYRKIFWTFSHFAWFTICEKSVKALFLRIK